MIYFKIFSRSDGCSSAAGSSVLITESIIATGNSGYICGS